MRLHIKIVLTIIVTLSILIYLVGFIPIFAQAGVITGRIEDIKNSIPVAKAIVSLTDTVGDIHSVSTDEKGYYFFNNLAVNANCVITANAVVNGKTMVFKDIIPHPVAANETYDAGTADAESTALALIVEELKEQGLTYEDIDLGEIQASKNFKRIEEKVLDILKDNGNVMDDLGAGTAYNVTVTRAPSSNADLSSLSVSEGTLDSDFSSNTTTYEVAVANSVESITFTPTAVEPETTIINVDGTPMASGVPSAPVILGVGANTIDIVVTAEDGITTKTYTVTVIRALSSNADLSNLLVSEGTLDPDFYSNTPTYEVAVTNSISSITFTPTAVEPVIATIKVDGIPVASGVPSVPVNLDIRDNSIFIEVTAEDETTKTYTITVNRNILNDNADLCNLLLSVGTLDPVFDSNTISYNVVLPYGTKTVPTVGATTSDSNASRKITQAKRITGDEKNRTATVLVTAEDGSTQKTYTVIFTVAAPNTDATLSALTVSEGTLNPEVNPAVISYNVVLSSGTTTAPTVGATTSDSNASKEITQAKRITGDEKSRTATVLVTAKDGSTRKTYTVIFTVAAPNTDATLIALTLSEGTLNPGFESDVISYNVELPYGTTDVPTVGATTTDSNASQKITQAKKLTGNEKNRTATVVVTAEDGTKLTYTVNFLQF